MTSYEGHDAVQPFRQSDENPGPSGARAPRGKLSARAGADPGRGALRHPESTSIPGARRNGRGPGRRSDSSLRNQPRLLRGPGVATPGPPPRRCRRGSVTASRYPEVSPPPEREACVTIRRTSSLSTVASSVGDALRRAGIRAVLTGGACASIHSAGKYSSVDADFILEGEVERGQLDAALATLGFQRAGDRYVHSETPFYVEFPRGPLAIGADDRIRPIERVSGNRRYLALSATDSCRDRLAAFYHWNDRQSFDVAILIARRNRVRWSVIERWSRAEGFGERYEEFLKSARRARGARSRP
jgi:hypothetical protein